MEINITTNNCKVCEYMDVLHFIGGVRMFCSIAKKECGKTCYVEQEPITYVYKPEKDNEEQMSFL